MSGVSITKSSDASSVITTYPLRADLINSLALSCALSRISCGVFALLMRFKISSFAASVVLVSECVTFVPSVYSAPLALSSGIDTLVTGKILSMPCGLLIARISSSNLMLSMSGFSLCRSTALIVSTMLSNCTSDRYFLALVSRTVAEVTPSHSTTLSIHPCSFTASSLTRYGLPPLTSSMPSLMCSAGISLSSSSAPCGISTVQ